MGSVILENVDDFIAPSQACVNPLFTSARVATKGEGDDDEGKKNIDGKGGKASGFDGVSSSGGGGGGGVVPRRRKAGRRRRPLPQAAPTTAAITENGTTMGGGTSPGDGTSGSGEGLPRVAIGALAASQSPLRKRAAAGDGPEGASSSAKPPPPPPPRGVRTRPTKMTLSYAPRDDDDDDPAVTSAANDLLAEEERERRSEKKGGEAATVSVADCLACSGCVTSAEAVLVESHSADALKRECGRSVPTATVAGEGEGEGEGANGTNEIRRRRRRRVAFTVSPACVADLTRHLYVDTVKATAREREEEKKESSRTAAVTAADPKTAFRRLASFLHKEYGASLILDGTLPRDISLIESAEEFCHRYRTLSKREGGGDANGGRDRKRDDIDISTPSIALSSVETRYLLQDAGGETPTEAITLRHPPGRDSRLDEDVGAIPDFPVLASSCPGFVCYVEKTAPKAVPNLGTAKSPMAIAGVLAKRIFRPRDDGGGGSSDDDDGDDAADSNVYHVAVMPCHDKKLEAGRRDLAWEQTVEEDGGRPTSSAAEGGGELSADVDLVITTTELLQLLTEAAENAQKDGRGEGSDGSEGGVRVDVRAYFDSLAPMDAGDFERLGANGGSPLWGSSSGGAKVLLGDSNGQKGANPDVNGDIDPVGSAAANGAAKGGSHLIGSGAYAEYIFRYASLRLFGHRISEGGALPWKRAGAAAGEGGRGVVRRRRVRRSGSSENGGVAAAAHSDMVEVGLYRLPDGTYSTVPPTNLPGGETTAVEPVLRFAAAYGFKNVQLVLQGLGRQDDDNTPPIDGALARNRRAPRKKSRHHFVEVMACPSGCLNGGGQIREGGGVAPATAAAPGDDIAAVPVKAGGRRETPAQTRERVRKNAASMDRLAPCPPIRAVNGEGDGDGRGGGIASLLYGGEDGDENPAGENGGVGGRAGHGPFGRRARELLHTRFHAVPKLELTAGVTAGVAIEDTKW